MKNVPTSLIRGSLFSAFVIFSVVTLPHHSLAQWTVTDPAHTAVSAGNAASTFGINTKEYVLDPLAYSVSKIALHSLTKSAVNWINSGFNGSPAFVQDLNQTLLSVADAQAAQFAREFSDTGSLRNVPWKDDVSQAVLANYYRNTSRNSFSLQNAFTLDQVSNDPEAFVRGDYSKGGIDAWMSLVLNPGNNPLALFQNAGRSLNSRVSTAQGQKITELNWSNGYNSYRGDCVDPSESPSGVAAHSAAGTNATSLTTANQECLNQPILTPGALISNSANKFLVDNGVDEFISSDEISELVNALMGQLIGNVLGGGGVAGVSRPTPGGGSSYIDRATDPSASTSGSLELSTEFLTTLGNQLSHITQYKNAWNKVAEAATSARGAVGGTTCALVDSTLAQAGTEVASATSAINQLNAIKNQLTANVARDPNSQQTIVANATASYQNLQASGLLPTLSELDYISVESQSRPADSENNVSASLYTKMVDISTTRVCSS